MKKLLLAFILFALLSTLLLACADIYSSSNTGDSGNSNATAVHMNETNFLQPSVTIHKGGSINLIDDVAVVHIIMNGSWVNGTAQPKKESGAPTVNANFGGSDSHVVGPFNTVGTYHLYCVIHTDMNLTVLVQ
jgi:plastocyanin